MTRRAFTLTELVVVLLILAATAGMFVPLVAGKGREAQEESTRASLARIREVIVVDYASHLPDHPPASVSDLLRQPSGAPEWDPVRRTGWNGPYFLAPGRFDFARLDEVPGHGFGAHGADGDLALLDGWGRPIVLLDVGTADERLASAGPDGSLDAADDNITLELRPAP